MLSRKREKRSSGVVQLTYRLQRLELEVTTRGGVRLLPRLPGRWRHGRSSAQRRQRLPGPGGRRQQLLLRKNESGAWGCENRVCRLR